MENIVISGFSIEYNTTTEIYCGNKAIVKDRLLVEFKQDINIMKNRL